MFCHFHDVINEDIYLSIYLSIYKTIHSKAPEYLIELGKPVAVRIKTSPEIRLHWRPTRPENNYIVRCLSICLRRTTGVEQSAVGIKKN